MSKVLFAAAILCFVFFAAISISISIKEAIGCDGALLQGAFHFECIEN